MPEKFITKSDIPPSTNLIDVDVLKSSRVRMGKLYQKFLKRRLESDDGAYKRKCSEKMYLLRETRKELKKLIDDLS